MAFDQSAITEVFLPQIWCSQVSLSWTSSSPAGTWYQIYLDQALVWFGRRTSVRLPVALNGPHRVDIGTVAAGEEQTSFAMSLPPAPARRARLWWLGGSFLGNDIAGFRVYGSDDGSGYGSGGYGLGGYGSLDLATPIASITAYPAGIMTDGYGLGGYGLGGFGASAGKYTWTSDPLAAGNWTFAIASYDAAGNVGAPTITTVTIAAPPAAPAASSNGMRASYTYDVGTQEATVTWLASSQ